MATMSFVASLSSGQNAAMVSNGYVRGLAFMGQWWGDLLTLSVN